MLKKWQIIRSMKNKKFCHGSSRSVWMVMSSFWPNGVSHEVVEALDESLVSGSASRLWYQLDFYCTCTKVVGACGRRKKKEKRRKERKVGKLYRECRVTLPYIWHIFKMKRIQKYIKVYTSILLYIQKTYVPLHIVPIYSPMYIKNRLKNWTFIFFLLTVLFWCSTKALIPTLVQDSLWALGSYSCGPKYMLWKCWIEFVWLK